MKYESNITKLKIGRRLQSVIHSDQLQREVAVTLQSSNQRRIHNDGLAVDGRAIGRYNTNPLYVNPSKSPKKFQPEGKTGRRKFKSGKPHKTKYFKEGYKGFRQEIGRPVDKVNLQMSSKLLKDLSVERGNNEWFVGFKSQYGAKIRKGQESHFGKVIWGVAASDKRAAEKIVNAFIKDKLSK